MDQNPLSIYPNYQEILNTPGAVLSEEISTSEDLTETKALINKFLVGKFYLFDQAGEGYMAGIEVSKEEKADFYNREQTLSDIKEIIKNWIVNVAIETGMDDITAQDEEARLFTFGSHRLGANAIGGDIDTLLVCPNYVDRDKHFFEDLYNLFVQEENAKDIVKVPKALVPILTMKFRGIDIDLAFAKLDVQKIDKSLNLNNNNVLASIEESMVFGMNGPRNVDFIVKSVDKDENPDKIQTFRTTLRFLKMWAKNKGIYSNQMGYLMGISLAILVAKICQMFPNLQPNMLMEKFFDVYAHWDWESTPVLIAEIKQHENLKKFFDMQWYDPKSTFGEERIAKENKDMLTSPMMVATPAFPSMNSTQKVNRTTLAVIKKQFQIGLEVIKQKPVDWDKLFSKIDFFNDYFNFIEVSIFGIDEGEYNRWKGLIESQLIGFTNKLQEYADSHQHQRNLIFHPYPKAFERKDFENYFAQSHYYGVKFEKPPIPGTKEQGIDLFMAAYDFSKKINKRFNDEKFTSVDMRIYQLTRTQIPFLENNKAQAQEVKIQIPNEAVMNDPNNQLNMPRNPGPPNNGNGSNPFNKPPPQYNNPPPMNNGGGGFPNAPPSNIASNNVKRPMQSTSEEPSLTKKVQQDNGSEVKKPIEEKPKPIPKILSGLQNKKDPRLDKNKTAAPAVFKAVENKNNGKSQADDDDYLD